MRRTLPTAFALLFVCAALLVPSLPPHATARAQGPGSSDPPVIAPLSWSPPDGPVPARPERSGEEPSAPPLSAKRPDSMVAGGREASPAPETLLARARARLELVSVADRWGLAEEVAAGWLTTTEAVEDLARLRAAQPARSPLAIAWRAERGTPRFIAGADLLAGEATPSEPAAAARAFLSAHAALLRIADPESELHPSRIEVARDGDTAVRLERRHAGLEVWGEDAIVRLSGGRVTGFSGCLTPSPAVPLATEPRCSRADAEAAAREVALVRDGRVAEVTAAETVFFPAAHAGAARAETRPAPDAAEPDGASEGLRLAWAVTLRDGLDYRRLVFVDALDGAVLHAVSLVAEDAASGSGLDLQGVTRPLGLWEIGGTYYLIDASKPMFAAGAGQMPNDPRGAIWTLHANHTNLTRLSQVTSANPLDWSGRANAVSAAWSAALWYDFLQATFARDSYDDAGRTIKAVVDVGSNYNNAFWNGELIAFGNGDGETFSDLAGSLDVIGHELGHAVVEYTANLVYEYQPGAMNEHFADMFGALTEYYAAEQAGGEGDWWIGEDVTTPGIAGDCLRNMADPAAANVFDPPSPHYPTHMDEYFDWPASQDYGGVHINNTILSRAFVMVCDDIGRPAAGQIWYRALTHYLNRNSEFIDLRLGTLRAAEDLYGDGSAEGASIAVAFEAVGLVGEEGTPEEPDLPDNTGADYLALTQGSGDHIFRAPPDWNGVAPLEEISGNAMGPGGRPSFADDGLHCAWVDDGGDIFVAASNGTGRRQITDDGEWWSVALSPDGRYVAATTVYEDARIYRFDLEDPLGQTHFELTTQSDVDGGGPDNVVYADVMEYTVSGEFILYDALNRTELEGEIYEYWDLNMLRLSDGQCFRVFQPLPRGESVGNPALAQNRDDVIAYDHIGASGRVTVMATNLVTGDTGLVTDNGYELAHPAFAGDDQAIYYEYDVKPLGGIWLVSLEADGLSGAGDDELWARGVGSPVWFTIGTRPSPVRLDFLRGIWRAQEIELSWSVPAPEDWLGFHVARRPAGEDAGAWEARTAEPIPADPAGDGRYRFRDAAPEEEAIFGASLRYQLIGLALDGAREPLGELELAAEAGAAGGLRLALGPNPCRGTAEVSFRLPRAGRTDLALYDAQGRLVARPIHEAWLAAGEHRLDGALRDERGRPLAAGVYQARLAFGALRETQRLVLLD